MKNKTHLRAGLLLSLALSAVQSFAQTTYEPYTFTTLAGLAGIPGTNDGTGDVARFKYPSGVAVDHVGNVYVADGQNHTIRKIEPSGIVSTFAGSAGNSGSADGAGDTARFGDPSGVALDSSGNLYVAEYLDHTIRKVTPAGVVSTLAGSPGVSGTTDGTGDAARFNGPTGIAVDLAGNAYVADYLSSRIRKVTPTGVVTTLASGAFDQPYAIAVDSNGQVYVADEVNEAIRTVSPTGEVKTLAGQLGTRGSTDGLGNAARFHYPKGAAVDSLGNLYVGDTGNHLVRKVTAAGAVTTLAGVPGSAGGQDGTGSVARFDYPFGVAVDSAGNIYVADAYNHTIRKGSPQKIFLRYDAALGSLPETQGFTAVAEQATPPTVANGILHTVPTSTLPQPDGGVQFWTQTNALPPDFATKSYVLEANLHIISANYVPVDGPAVRSGYYLGATDGVGHRFAVGLASNGITIHTDGNFDTNQTVMFMPFNNTDTFHNYRFVIESGTGSLFIDGTLFSSVMIGAAGADSLFNRVFFGDASGRGISEAELRSFQFSDSATENANPPAITQQPESTIMGVGGTVTLKVIVEGSEPFNYQWYQGPSGDTSQPMAGATTASYTTGTITTPAFYWVRVSNSAGSVDSAAAGISVSTPPEMVVTPSPHFGHSLAYDKARGEIVLFGGATNGSPFSLADPSEMWIWKNERWSRLSLADHPEKVTDASMVYDDTRQVLVLLGGFSPDTPGAQTWEWDGSKWAKQNPANTPSSRIDFGMAYDSIRQKIVIFGGRAPIENNTTWLDETWEWDGSNWEQKNPANKPSPRNPAGMAYDATRHETVLFSGSGAPADTWVWDGNNWNQRSPLNSPPQRSVSGNNMAYDAERREIVMFGGAEGPLNDTWTWNGTNWMEKIVDIKPPGRWVFSMAYDASTKQTVLFGGFNGTTGLNDTWLWDGFKWTPSTDLSEYKPLPTVIGASTVVFSNITNAGAMSSTADGTLFLGNADVTGRIYRITTNGTIDTYGDLLTDADAVVVDREGQISGKAGSVLVGGRLASGDGDSGIVRIAPDGTTTTLFPPGPDLSNTDTMLFDHKGRLLICSFGNSKISYSTGGPPTKLFDLPFSPNGIAEDALSRLLIAGNSTTISLYSSDGTLINSSYVAAGAVYPPLTEGRGSIWGKDVFTVNNAGELLRIDLSGHPTVIGTGFSTNYILLHITDDGILYANEFALSRILKITPSGDVPFPQVSEQPLSQTVALGATASLTVQAIGMGLTYQWYRNANPILGAVSPTLSLSPVQLVDGGRYTVVVSDSAGDVESNPALLQIELPLIALTDHFSDRQIFSATNFIGTTNNISATLDGGEPRHAGKSGSNSLWMTWKAPASGVVTFSTVGSSFDTLLAVYTGSALDSLIETSSDEDRGGFLTSKLEFNAVAGTEYQVAVDGFAGANGVVVLSWSLEANAPALPIITQQPKSVLAVVGDSVTFNVAAQPAGVTYQWSLNGTNLIGQTSPVLTFTADASRLGTYRVRLTAPNGQTLESADAILEVLDQPQPGLRLSADKLDDLFAPDEVALAKIGKLRLAVTAPSQGWVQESDLSQSTRSPEDPEPCGVITSATRWFRVRPFVPASGHAQILLSTVGSDVPTVLGVFTNRNNLTLVACSADPQTGVKNATVVFPAVKDLDYLVMIGRLGEGAGKARLTYRGAEELSDFVVPFRVNGVNLEVQLFVAPGNYVWSWGGNVTTWTPLFQTNVPSGLFQYSEPFQFATPSRLFRLLPAK